MTGESAQEAYRRILAMCGIKKEHLILPVFVQEKGRRGSRPGAMPGIELWAPEKISDQVQAIVDSGIRSIIIFGIPESRDAAGSVAADDEGIVQKAVRRIKSEFGSAIYVITDVCICQYNLSGHCGVVTAGRNVSKANREEFDIDNDKTLKILAQIATSHAKAGADMVAPSSMMDGQVLSIRKALDAGGFNGVKIMSYSSKHASSLYSPFRSTAFFEGKRSQIDKSSYQVSYANPSQTLREIEADINEGADAVMIKPAMSYLDLVSLVKEEFSIPVAVQNVSGEYAMIKAASKRGWIDEEDWKVQLVASIRRAGADRIISYFSFDIARYLY